MEETWGKSFEFQGGRVHAQCHTISTTAWWQLPKWNTNHLLSHFPFFFTEIWFLLPFSLLSTCMQNQLLHENIWLDAHLSVSSTLTVKKTLLRTDGSSVQGEMRCYLIHILALQSLNFSKKAKQHRHKNTRVFKPFFSSSSAPTPIHTPTKNKTKQQKKPDSGRSWIKI